MIQPLGGFILVHLATPLEICEGRDRKGFTPKRAPGCSAIYRGLRSLRTADRRRRGD